MKSVFYLFGAIACASLFSFSQNLSADVIWNEGVNGDLSSLPASPTPLSFINGANTVIGSLNPNGGDSRDYLTFTIGVGQTLTGLTLDAFTPNGSSFNAMNSGSTSFIPGTDPASNFLGLSFVNNSQIGTDMLPVLGSGQNGSTGFSIPLGPGTYSYLIQEVSGGQTRSYQLTFNAVPEPSSVLLFGIAGLFAATRRGRRS